MMLLGERKQRSEENFQIAGWFPIYDTLEGIRGELYIVIRLELIIDINKFDNASTEVEFFAVSELDPSVYNIVSVGGLVSELIVANDPDYEFADNFRSSRISNEKRQNWMYRYFIYLLLLLYMLLKTSKNFMSLADVCMLFAYTLIQLQNGLHFTEASRIKGFGTRGERRNSL
jgi:hypothetical protein